MVEQGSPARGRISWLQSVTPDPVSNKARTLTPPKEMSTFGRENSGRVVLKQFKAVRHVISCWGMSRLKAIPVVVSQRPRVILVYSRFGSMEICVRSKWIMGVFIINPSAMSWRRERGLALEGPKFWRKRPRLVSNGVPCPFPRLAVKGV